MECAIRIKKIGRKPTPFSIPERCIQCCLCDASSQALGQLIDEDGVSAFPATQDLAERTERNELEHYVAGNGKQATQSAAKPLAMTERLDVKEELHHIALFNDIFLAFSAKPSLVARF